MRSNYWKSIYGITTFGESHSKAVGVVIEDVKPGIDFPLHKIQEALDKRRPGKTKFTSSRAEKDRLVILAGVFNGKTTGMPICLIVYNEDAKSNDYKILEELFRPGHADLAYFKKYKIFDHRGGGRASGRETISRVIAAQMVNPLVKDIDIEIYAKMIGKIEACCLDKYFISQNPLYWPCPKTYSLLEEHLQKLKNDKDSTGGIVEVKVTNIPEGLGDPVFDKLDANLAKAVLSIGSVKGIEFGLGFQLAEMYGSKAHQPLTSLTPSQPTNAGGIYGGVTTGEPVVFRFIVKPASSVGKPQTTVNREGKLFDIKMEGRFDTCIVPRIIPVAEAMIKLVLADAVSYQRMLQDEKESLTGYREAIDKLDEDILIALAKRKKIAEEIASYKKRRNIEAYQPHREKAVLNSLIEKAKQLSLDEELIKNIWEKIFENNRGKR